MPIKPVDFQIMLPKTSEVSKIHNEEHQKNLAAQQQQATSTQHKADEMLTQVHKQENVQNARIREKQEKDQKNKDKKKEQNKKKDGEQGSTIDIRL